MIIIKERNGKTHRVNELLVSPEEFFLELLKRGISEWTMDISKAAEAKLGWGLEAYLLSNKEIRGFLNTNGLAGTIRIVEYTLASEKLRREK